MGSISGLKSNLLPFSICALAVYWIKTKEKMIYSMKYLLINAIVKETHNKFYGAVYQGLDNNLLGNCVITCVYTLIWFQQVLWRRCRGLDNSPLVIGS